MFRIILTLCSDDDDDDDDDVVVVLQAGRQSVHVSTPILSTQNA